jgi:hypothetical protein
MRAATITPTRLFIRTVAIPLLAVVLAVLVCFLPNDPYQRYQQLDGTSYQTVHWAYERIHDDPTPIDVLILGSSRTLLGLRTSLIEQRLAEAGKPAHVVNTSLVGEGRDSEWEIYQEIVKAHRHPKVIVMMIAGSPRPWGHESFKYIAPAPDVLTEARHGLYAGVRDLMYLPYRQMHMFAALVAPVAFELPRTFDPARYAATRTDFTTSFFAPEGGWKEMEKPQTLEYLERELRAHPEGYIRHSVVPAPFRRITDADEAIYVDLILREAARQGSKVLFVYIPGYAEQPKIMGREYYERFGPIQDNSDLIRQHPLFADWEHLNGHGAVIASDRVAAAVARCCLSSPASGRAGTSRY